METGESLTDQHDTILLFPSKPTFWNFGILDTIIDPTEMILCHILIPRYLFFCFIFLLNFLFLFFCQRPNFNNPSISVSNCQ